MRERIRVDGEPLSEELFARYFFEVWERLEADPKVRITYPLPTDYTDPIQTLTPHTPTFPIYFRLLTLMAFHTFLSLGVKATVLEVGIGGTYDSTNIVPKPITTGVSSLGLDHTAVLGSTIEEIAKNKAGIYKAGIPALSVKQEQGGEVLRNIAEEVGARFEVVPSIPDTPLGLKGEHQKINASLAVASSKSFLSTTGHHQSFTDTEILPKSFIDPLRRTKWPGRCQRVEQGETTWLLDGAHTTESLRSCGEWAWGEGNGEAERQNPDVLIFNCSGGRAGESLLGSLLDAGASKKGKKREELGLGFDTVIFCTNVTYADGGFKGGTCFLLQSSTPLYHYSCTVYTPVSL